MKRLARFVALSFVLAAPAFAYEAPARSTAKEVSLGAAPELGPGPALSAAQLPELGPVLTAAPVLAVEAPSIMAPGPESDLAGFAQLVLEAAASKQWALLVALALVAAVYVLRRFLTPYVPFLGTDVGGFLLSIVSSVGGALVTALAAGQAPSLGLVLNALIIALAGSGGFSGVKRLMGKSAVQKAEEEGAEARALAEQAGRDSVAAWAGGQK